MNALQIDVLERDATIKTLRSEEARLLKENATLAADNAALLTRLGAVVACPDKRSAGGAKAHAEAAEACLQPHPGAALLKERAEKDAYIKALADALDKACSTCHGRMEWDSSCSRCGDSTEDHVCNDKTYPCDAGIHATAAAARAKVLP